MNAPLPTSENAAPTIPSTPDLPRRPVWWVLAMMGWIHFQCLGQTLLNIDFGGVAASTRTGPAAVGLSTNDFWNAYSHYRPRHLPGATPVPNGTLSDLKYADHSASPITVGVRNAPGVWGNSSGDAMWDRFIFAPDGSKITVELAGIPAGLYQLVLYGHADADVHPAQDAVFQVIHGDIRLPAIPASWVSPARGSVSAEGFPCHVVRELNLESNRPVTIEILPQAGGLAVLNGLQLLSRGTSPPRPVVSTPLPVAPAPPTLREIHYAGEIAGEHVRFHVRLFVTGNSHAEAITRLFQGMPVLESPRVPEGWRLVAANGGIDLASSRPGDAMVEFDLLMPAAWKEPWRSVEWQGPIAAVASLELRTGPNDSDLQFTGATMIQVQPGLNRGAVGGSGRVAFQWQSRGQLRERETLLAMHSQSGAKVSSGGVRVRSDLRIEVIQGRAAALDLVVAPGHRLFEVTGGFVRQWKEEPVPDGSRVHVDFIRPLEGVIEIAVVTHATVGNLPFNVSVAPPVVQGLIRESGVLSVRASDVSVAVTSPAQGPFERVEAESGDAAAFQFHGRPFSVVVAAQPQRAELSAAHRLVARLDDGRITWRNHADVAVSAPGVYALEFEVPAGWNAVDVRGPGLDEWRLNDGVLRMSFAQRVTGSISLVADLERSLGNPADGFTLEPLRLRGATQTRSFIGVSAIQGLSLKTSSVERAGEMPPEQLPDRNEAQLAFRSDSDSFKIQLAAERLVGRKIAEVFNLMTVGDGTIGGSATFRFAILQQGVQQFRVRLPAHWRNVDLTGPDIRRIDRNGTDWTLTLQDKVWDAYTLVVTYDAPFDTLTGIVDAAGAHAMDVDRETGTIAVTSAAGLLLDSPTVAEPLRRMDPSELDPADRSMISRQIVFAGRYHGSDFTLGLRFNRLAPLTVLDAVADRAQFTSVISETGEMISQASFWVKNAERQFQKFRLPKGATLWGVSVAGEPSRAERDGDWIVVGLPQHLNRDIAIPVDIKYTEQVSVPGKYLPQTIPLVAPGTDIAGAYAEWNVYVPERHQMTGYEGAMTSTEPAGYSLAEGWRRFVAGLFSFLSAHGKALIITSAVGSLAILGGWLLLRSRTTVIEFLVLVGVLAILGGMMLPALSKAKARAQRIHSVNNLKNIGLAMRIYASEHENRFPKDFSEISHELGSPKVLIDPEDGHTYTYLGYLKDPENPAIIVAHSNNKNGHREILVADGSVQQVTEAQFQNAMNERARAVAESFRKSGGQMLAVAANPASNQPGVAPFAEGMRSLRIDIPTVGRAYRFTRTVTLAGEPPSLNITIAPRKARMAGRTIGFLGLMLAGVWWVRREVAVGRPPRHAGVAIGILVALLGFTGLSVTWHSLHIVLGIAAPLTAAGAVVWLVRRTLWHRIFAPFQQPDLAAAVLGFLAVLEFATSSRTLAAELPRAPVQSPHPVSILDARYVGTAGESAMIVQADWTLKSASTNQTIRLLVADASATRFEVAEGKAELWREGSHVGVRLPDAGTAKIRMALVLPIENREGRQIVKFENPESLSSKWVVDLGEPDARVEFQGAVHWSQSTSNRITRVEGVVPGGRPMVLSWNPAAGRNATDAPSSAASVLQISRIHVSSSGLRSHSMFRFPAGTHRPTEARFQLPGGWRVIRVDGDTVRDWSIPPSQTNQLSVELVPGSHAASGQNEIQMELQRDQSLPALPADAEIRLPRALAVREESAFLGLSVAASLSTEIRETLGLDRMDVGEFVRMRGGPAAGPLLAWKADPGSAVLRLRIGQIQTRLDAVSHTDFTVDRDVVLATTRWQLQAIRGGLFSVKGELAPDIRIDGIEGEFVRDWTDRSENGIRSVQIHFAKKLTNATEVVVRFRRTWPDARSTVELPMFRLSDSDKASGWFRVAAEPGIALKTARIDGVTEVPVGSIEVVPHPNPTIASSPRPVLAYRTSLAADGAARAAGISLQIEHLPARVRTETMHFLTVGETHSTGRAVVRCQVENAPVQSFRMVLPGDWKNVEIVGEGIRRKDRSATNGEWRVEFQHPLRGDYQLQLHWEQDRQGTNDIVFSMARFPDSDRDAGYVSTGSRDGWQLSPRIEGTELRRIESQELPEWVLALPGGTPAPGNERARLVFAYPQPAGRLLLAPQRFGGAAVLHALAERIRLQSVVSESGQWLTRMEWVVHNNGRQHIGVRLPAGARVWSVFVDGQPIRPSIREQTLLLPLERSTTTAAPIPVEITFAGILTVPASGDLALESPALDIPVKDARWELYLPPGRSYSRFAGSMTREELGVAAILSDFTLADYSQKEADRARVQGSLLSSAVRRVRDEVAIGNLAYANSQLDQLRGQSVGGGQVEDIKNLEAELNRVNVSNFIDSKNALNTALKARYGLAVPRKVAAPPDVDARNSRELRIAEEQVLRLQKAQAVGIRRVQPLRINLPTRGLRHSFTQVLQTEINKPLTIRFTSNPETRNGRFVWIIATAVLSALAWAASRWLISRESDSEEISQPVPPAL